MHTRRGVLCRTKKKIRDDFVFGLVTVVDYKETLERRIGANWQKLMEIG